MKRFEDYHSWMENEVRMSYIEDQVRHASVVGNAIHYSSTEDDGSVVKLGNKSIADAQREADEAAGGLVALMFARKY